MENKSQDKLEDFELPDFVQEEIRLLKESIDNLKETVLHNITNNSTSTDVEGILK